MLSNELVGGAILGIYWLEKVAVQTARSEARAVKAVLLA